MARLVYAQAGANSPSVGGIGWVDFGDFTLAPGQSMTGISAALLDGSTVTFDISNTTTALTGDTFIAVNPPVTVTAPFGNTGYRGIVGNVVLYEPPLTVGVQRGTLIEINNIVVRDGTGNVVPDFVLIAADGETVDQFERMVWTTNGEAWQQLVILPPVFGTEPASPQIIGIGTNVVQEIGLPSRSGDTQAPVIYTYGPTQISLQLTNVSTRRMGLAIGFAINKLSLYKNITGRVNAADQFELTIQNGVRESVITSGGSTGIQNESVQVFGRAGEIYTVTEAMALGSVSSLINYDVTLEAVNLAAGGTIPPVNELPQSIQLALGDVISYTVTNTPIVVPIEVDVSVIKEADTSFLYEDGSILFRIDVINSGRDSAEDVQLIDPLSPQLSGAGYSLDNGSTWQTWSGSYDIGILESGGSVDILLRAQLTAIDGSGTLINTARVTTSSFDINTGNDEVTITLRIPSEYVDLAITKEADTSLLYQGGGILFKLNVTNNGPNTAENVQLIDRLPDSLSDAVYSIDNGSTWQAWSGSYEVGTLASGASTNILISAQLAVIDGSGTLVNTAEVTTTSFDINVANNETTITVPIPREYVDLTLTKEADSSLLYEEGFIIYRIHVMNNGLGAAENVQLVDQLPAQLGSSSFSLDNGGTWQTWSSSYDIGTLDPGGSISILLMAWLIAVDSTGLLSNAAKVTTTSYDRNILDNEVTVTIPIPRVYADLMLIDQTRQCTVEAGKWITYKMTVMNLGPFPAVNIRLTDSCPCEIVNPKYSIDCGRSWCKWTGCYMLGTLIPGEEQTILLRGRVDEAAYGWICNEFTVRSQILDLNLYNNSVSSSIRIVPNH